MLLYQGWDEIEVMVIGFTFGHSVRSIVRITWSYWSLIPQLSSDAGRLSSSY